MSRVVCFSSFQSGFVIHSIEQKGEHSWWVVRRPLGGDGSPLPCGRIVYFCRAFAEAEVWVHRQESADLRNDNRMLAVTA